MKLLCLKNQKIKTNELKINFVKIIFYTLNIEHLNQILFTIRK